MRIERKKPPPSQKKTSATQWKHNADAAEKRSHWYLEPAAGRRMWITGPSRRIGGRCRNTDKVWQQASEHRCRKMAASLGRLPRWPGKCAEGPPNACEARRSQPRGSLFCHAGAKRTALNANLAPAAADRANKTSNQTSGGSLVSCPRLPMFGSFPFRFPLRGEKGSAPRGAGGKK